MKLKMSDKSLFATLLRKPWWVSALIAGTMALLAFVLLPEKYKAIGSFSGFPFVVIAVMAAWRQRDVPSEESVSRTAQVLATLTWPAFADLLSQAFQRDGHTVTRRSGAADFEVDRNGRRLLVSAKRWKSAHTGLEPLRLLQAERDKLEAVDAVYVSLGDLSDGARAFARENSLTIWQAHELAQVLRGLMPLPPKA